MVKTAVGMIETVGLAAAVEAADAAVKAANVQLIGYELTKGGGMVLVKLTGDVGAVKAAVEAAKAAAENVNKVVATLVIPRTYGELSCMLITKETVGIAQQKPQATGNEQQGENVEAAKPEADKSETASQQQEAEDISSDTTNETESVTCNLCSDPACSRRKGDPRVNCLHYNDKNEESE